MSKNRNKLQFQCSTENIAKKIEEVKLALWNNFAIPNEKVIDSLESLDEYYVDTRKSLLNVYKHPNKMVEIEQDTIRYLDKLSENRIKRYGENNS